MTAPTSRSSRSVLAAALTCLLLPAPLLAATPTSYAAPSVEQSAATAPTTAIVTGRAATSGPRVTPRRPILKERTRFSGDLPGGVRPVTLERRSGARWKPVTRGRTSRSGGYRLTTAARAGTYRVTAGASGGAPATTSRPAQVRLARQSVRLVDVDAPWTTQLDSTVVVDVSPARRSRVVVLQRRQGPRWNDLATSRTNAAGTARLTYEPSEVGTRTYRVLARPFRGSRGAVSKQVRVRTAGAVERASVGTPPGGEAFSPSLSADGLLVAFTSNEALLPADTDATDDIYLFDRRTGELSLAVPSALGHVNNPYLSRTGRFLAFQTLATNLAPGDDGSDYDVFVLDRRTGEFSLVSATPSGAPAAGNSYAHAISGDGRFVAFTSTSTELVGFNPPPNNSVRHAYLRDRTSGVTRGLDRSGLGWSAQNIFSLDLSLDGSRVAFSSSDLDLDPGNVNGSAVYAWDIAADGSISDRTNVVPGTHASIPVLSGDGATIGFTSENDLDPDDNDGERDGYLLLPSGDVVPAGPVGDGESTMLDLSGDGRWLALVTEAVLPDDSNGDDKDVIVYDTTSETIDFFTRSGAGASAEASLSARADVLAVGSRASLGGAVGEYEIFTVALR